MVFSVALLALAPIIASVVVPTTGFIFANLGQPFVFQDGNGTNVSAADGVHGPYFGTAIVAAPFDSSLPQNQVWSLSAVGNDQVQFVTRRDSGATSYLVGAHVDGLENKDFNAQDSGFGSAISPVEPYGAGSRVYSFLFSDTNPSLAVTSAPEANKPLTLEVYDASNKLQQWVIYDHPAPGVRPASLETLQIASIAQVLAASKNL